jgi:hypothetical protein
MDEYVPYVPDWSGYTDAEQMPDHIWRAWMSAGHPPLQNRIELPPARFKKHHALEAGFFSGFSAAERAADRIIGDGPSRFAIERALELVPLQHLEALLAHEDFRILYVPRLPALDIDPLSHKARIKYIAGVCRGKHITVADDSGHVASVLLHEIGHALDNVSNGQLAKTFGPRLREIFEFLALKPSSHFASDDERFAEAYSMAVCPSSRDLFGLPSVHSREIKGLLGNVLSNIKAVRL